MFKVGIFLHLWCVSFAFERVCYLVTDHSNTIETLAKLSPKLCTVINVMPLGISDVEPTTVIVNASRDEAIIGYVTNLRSLNPSLKVLGTLTASNLRWNQVSFDKTVAAEFAKNTVKFLIQYELDGLDIDWEFPYYSTGVYVERQNYINLLQALKLELSKVGLLLSTAVAADETIAVLAYDFKSLVNSVDYINIMSYDYYDYKRYFPFTGHNSALFQRADQLSYFSTLNTAFSANYWHKVAGFNKSQIMVGIPTYAHSYILW